LLRARLTGTIIGVDYTGSVADSIPGGVIIRHATDLCGMERLDRA
jgi:hypothetical protein